MQTFEYIIKDEAGIHARPAGLLVKKVSGLTSTVTLTKDEKSVNASKLFAVLSLGVKCGDKITINISGENEVEDAKIIENFFAENF